MTQQDAENEAQDRNDQELLDEQLVIEMVTDRTCQVLFYLDMVPHGVHAMAWVVAFALDQVCLAVEQKLGVPYRDFDKKVMGARGMLMARRPDKRKPKPDFSDWPFRGGE